MNFPCSTKHKGERAGLFPLAQVAGAILLIRQPFPLPAQSGRGEVV
jgi:hypothetical protein